MIMAKRSLMMAMIFSFLMASMASFSSVSFADTIKERIQGSQGTDALTDLEKSVDDTTSDTVKVARRIFVSLTLIFGIWLGIGYLRAGFSPDALRETKGRIAFFLLFLILSFWTEQILGFIFKMLGIDLSTL